MTEPHRETFRSIQIARCFAAVAVVLHHSISLTNDFSPNGAGVPAWLNFGFAGVDFFFVISGFIISLVIEGYKGSSISFLVRRACRIVPFYWLFTAIWLLISLAGSKPISGGLSGIILSFLLLPTEGFPVLGVGWSLQHEFIFYTLAAFLIRVRWTLKLPLILGGLFLAAVAWHVLLPGTKNGGTWDLKVFSLYHFDFLLGALLFRYRHNIPSGFPARLLLTGVGMFLITAFLVSTLYDGGHVPTAPKGVEGLVRVVAFGISSTILLAGMIALERRRSAIYDMPLFKTAEAVGDASYALYLLHPIFFAVLGTVIGKISPPPNSAAFVAIAGTAFACLIATVWYRLVEKPYLDLVTGKGRRRQDLAFDGPA